MKYWFLIVCIWIPGLISAQNSRDSIIAVINNLFDAMRDADGNRLKACFADSAILQTIRASQLNSVSIHTGYISDFAATISKEGRGNADERIKIDAVHIDGALASVWAPYSFYYKGTFSHCGVNSFQLVRLASGWKIQYLIDTRRKTGCKNE